MDIQPGASGSSCDHEEQEEVVPCGTCTGDHGQTQFPLWGT